MSWRSMCKRSFNQAVGPPAWKNCHTTMNHCRMFHGAELCERASHMNLTDTLSLTGKRALITGAAKGIGAAIAQLFAERGASLFLLDIDEANLETTASQLRDLGLEVQAIVADVAETERVTKLLADSRTEIDILINNAGISG